jgi:hypothetical protein
MLYVDGQEITNGSGTLYFPNLSVRTNGFKLGSDVNGANQGAGTYADLETFNYPVDAGTIQTNYTNFLTAVPPVILTQPASQVIAQGQDVTFSVNVSSLSPPAYQWKCNGVSINGATNLSYTVYVAQPNQDGQVYSVVVSNNAGALTSSNATLGVVTPISLVSGPASQSVVVGANVSFDVWAAGNYLSYQWSTNGVPLVNGSRISGVVNSNLTISTVAVSDANTYAVNVTNLFGNVTAGATLTVVTNPSISYMSPNTNIIQSQDVTFTVTASGGPIQWYFSNYLGNASIPNATQPTYTQLVVQPTNGGIYSVIVTNIAGKATNSTLLNVLVPPWVTSQPTNLTVSQ